MYHKRYMQSRKPGLREVEGDERNKRKLMAARPGFEPGISAPKADVLPLHHRATLGAGLSLLLYTGLISILPPLPGGVKGRGAGYGVI